MLNFCFCKRINWNQVFNFRVQWWEYYEARVVLLVMILIKQLRDFVFCALCLSI